MKQEINVADTFAGTKVGNFFGFLRYKWKLIFITTALLYIYINFNWSIFLFIGLVPSFLLCLSFYNTYKFLNKNRFLYKLAEKHVEKFEDDWAKLEPSFSDDIYQENEEYLNSNNKEIKDYDICRLKVDDNYEDVYLDLHEQFEYHQNMLNEIEKIRNQIKSVGSPFDNKKPLSHPDDKFFTIETIIRRVLSTKFKYHQPIVHLDEYIHAYNDFFSKIKNYHEKEYNIINKGISGENNTENELKLLKQTHEVDYLDNIVLNYDSKTFETDFLLFSKQGIFTLEVKNIGGNQKFTIRITPDGQWLKVFNNGKSEPMQDVTSQMNYHISMTNLLLARYKKETGIELPNIQPVYIIANNDVVIDNQSGLNIFRPSYFVHFLRKQERNCNMKDLKGFMSWLEGYRTEAKKYPVKNYLKQYKNLAENLLVTLNINHIYKKIIDEMFEEIKQDSKLLDFVLREYRDF